MYEGDRSRKQTLVDFGFRLPSALDNRPLKVPEFEALCPQIIHVSATPGPIELAKTKGEVVEQVIRPTGLVDPEIILHPITGQIQDLMGRITETVKRGERTLVTTLTKRMAEDLTEFLTQKEFRVRYMHSDIDALERINIIQGLRKGDFDVLIGINLLREGLDLPEVSLVAVLDADKEGFLRSETTLIQICGRAARNVGGRVVLYADNITGSMKRAMDEMDRRREKQEAYNREHGISPKTIVKAVQNLEEFQATARTKGLHKAFWDTDVDLSDKKKFAGLLKELDTQMRAAADVLDFETAAQLRDRLRELKAMQVKDGARV
jgi:excinuclease ABC subunit B